MKLSDMAAAFFRAPVLTRRRIWMALAVAVLVDGVQLVLGPAGWIFLDEVADVVAMILTCWLLGFHPLLLPTFALEFFPVVDMLPTWTGCVSLVVTLRLRRQRAPLHPPPVLGPP